MIVIYPRWGCKANRAGVLQFLVSNTPNTIFCAHLFFRHSSVELADPVYHRQSVGYSENCGVRDEMVRDNDEYTSREYPPDTIRDSLLCDKVHGQEILDVRKALAFVGFTHKSQRAICYCMSAPTRHSNLTCDRGNREWAPMAM
ncbi:hypothetical protein DFH94DRAFT_120335 [Russula ochroleuca]|uniref:Uncharacterized protein n=1 Tax=Russula ochroleuca TaxID=152965 RepID=A0A9P5MRI7_9AGAM|nr:hypothetical protein DFH94DRAFT_120335 [Russula ochroleuca]